MVIKIERNSKNETLLFFGAARAYKKAGVVINTDNPPQVGMMYGNSCINFGNPRNNIFKFLGK